MIVVAAEVFKKAFIPQKLADIDHYEREIAKMGSKGAENNGGCVPVLRSPWRVLVLALVRTASHTGLHDVD